MSFDMPRICFDFIQIFHFLNPFFVFPIFIVTALVFLFANHLYVMWGLGNDPHVSRVAA